jgi:hypothetical protein
MPVPIERPIRRRPAKESKVCEEHGCELMWADCGNCFEGFTGHDCGEDCCCCLYPEDNVTCDICYGAGGFFLCPVCSPNADF